MVQSSLSIRELSPEAQRPDLYLKRLLCVAVLANPPRRNEAFVIPHRVGREILDRDTQFCMPGLVWITQRVHKRCEGHRVTLLCRQKLLSGLAEADMSKTSSCQPWQPDCCCLWRCTARPSQQQPTHPTICSNEVLVLIPTLLSMSSPRGSSGTFAGMKIFQFLSPLWSFMSPFQTALSQSFPTK